MMLNHKTRTFTLDISWKNHISHLGLLELVFTVILSNIVEWQYHAVELGFGTLHFGHDPPLGISSFLFA